MNFYKHYIGDFQRDTGHLSLMERGAYRALLDAHYACERPLPVDKSQLCRLVGAFSAGEKRAIDRVLNEFWEKTDSGWINSRAQKEIARAAHQREVNQRVGLLGGRPKKTESVTESVSESEPINNPIQTPDTRHQDKRERRAQRAPARGTRLPDDWGLSAQRSEYARKQGLDPVRTHEKFTNYWQAASGRTASKRDWDAAWRTWCLNEAERGTHKQAFNAKPAHGPAEQAWTDLIVSDGAKRDSRVQRALEAIGGWLAVKGRNQFNEKTLREQFCRAYTEAA